MKIVKSKVIVWSYLSKQLQNICLNYFLSTFYLCHLYVILKRKDRRVRLPFEHWSLSRVHCKKNPSDNQNFSFKSCEILVTWGKIMKKENKAKPTPPPIILLYQPKGNFSVLRKKKKKCYSKCLSFPGFSFGLGYFRLSHPLDASLDQQDSWGLSIFASYLPLHPTWKYSANELEITLRMK